MYSNGKVEKMKKTHGKDEYARRDEKRYKGEYQRRDKRQQHKDE